MNAIYDMEPSSQTQWLRSVRHVVIDEADLLFTGGYLPLLNRMFEVLQCRRDECLHGLCFCLQVHFKTVSMCLAAPSWGICQRPVDPLHCFLSRMILFLDGFAVTRELCDKSLKKPVCCQQADFCIGCLFTGCLFVHFKPLISVWMLLLSSLCPDPGFLQLSFVSGLCVGASAYAHHLQCAIVYITMRMSLCLHSLGTDAALSYINALASIL